MGPFRRALTAGVCLSLVTLGVATLGRVSGAELVSWKNRESGHGLTASRQDTASARLRAAARRAAARRAAAARARNVHAIPTTGKEPPVLPVQAEAAMLVFPWPPPKASAKYPLPRHLISAGPVDTLGSVAQRIENAIVRAGIEEWAVYGIPDSGFVYVTRLERIEADGRPKPGRDRWPGEDRLRPRSFGSYLRSLFVAEPGYYRVIAIVVTGRGTPVVDVGTPLRSDHATTFLHGPRFLPDSVHHVRAQGVQATALIYQYKSDTPDAAPRLLASIVGTPVQHLAHAGLWSGQQLRRQ